MKKLFSLRFDRVYANFNSPISEVDCGAICAQFNPSGLPYCCDICQAVPVAYKEEWAHLEQKTKLWHLWRGDECAQDQTDPTALSAETPGHMCLIACKGPAWCERENRSVSCRQFPFFPYITADDRFIGIAYNWDFESVCWVINHLEKVSEGYRREFIETYDHLLFDLPGDYESYYALSEDMREYFTAARRRIPLWHRDGKFYLLSPRSGRLTMADPANLRKFGMYKDYLRSTVR